MREISSQITTRLPFEGLFSLTELSSFSTEMVGQLNESEREEFKEITNARRQQEYVCSRLALKKLIGNWGVKGEEFVIRKNKLGRPYGSVRGQQYFVSIAHTRQNIFCGITKDTPIGIDLEQAKRKVPQHLKQRMLHPGETTQISRLPALRIWTIKEAYLKLLGQGLRLNMKEVKLQQNESDFFVEINNDKTAKICSFQLENNWLAISYF